MESFCKLIEFHFALISLKKAYRLKQKLCSQRIQLDQTDEEKPLAKREFYAKAGFPVVTMCVDGTEEDFFYCNRKDYFRINFMLMLRVLVN